jgi:hypothetical protein
LNKRAFLLSENELPFNGCSVLTHKRRLPLNKKAFLSNGRVFLLSERGFRFEPEGPPVERDRVPVERAYGTCWRERPSVEQESLPVE